VGAFDLIFIQNWALSSSFNDSDSDSNFHFLNDFKRNIDKHRKNRFTIFLFDENGKPIKDKRVEVKQRKHEFCFGGALFTPLFEKGNYPYEKKQILIRADEMFNLVVDGNGFKWKNIERYEGKISYGFRRHKRVTSWAESHNKRLRYHCLFWSDPKHNPDWLKHLSNAKFKSALFNRIRYTKENIGARLESMDVINEMLYFRYYRDRLGDDIIKIIFEEVKNVFPNTRLYLNEWPPQNGQGFSSFNNYVTLIRKFKEQDIPFDGIGLQAHFNAAALKSLNITIPECITQMNVAINNIAKFAGLPVLITEFDIIAKDEKFRADFLEAFYTMAFSNKNVEGIIAWEWFDLGKPNALVTRDGFLTQAGRRYYDLVLDQWWTDTALVSDFEGKIVIDAFYGEYKLILNRNEKGYPKTVVLGKKTPGSIFLFFNN
jgi:GH35 family endo-1,4-beta-xylanase